VSLAHNPIKAHDPSEELESERQLASHLEMELATAQREIERLRAALKQIEESGDAATHHSYRIASNALNPKSK